jgi:hypothetical protein
VFGGYLLLRRIFTTVAGLALGAAVLSTAFASPQLVYQRSSPAKVGGIYLSHGLLPGHHYQIRVVAKGHVKIAALGTQQITYFVKGQLQTLTKPVNFAGKTPFNLTLNQPGKVTAMAWIFAMQVTDQVHKTLTVKLFDLGTHG